MKRIKSFENFNKNEKIEEFVNAPYPESITKAPEERIANEIEIALDEYNANPNEFANIVDEDRLREKLLKKAKENNYRGSVEIRTSRGDSRAFHHGKKFIVYEPKNSILQDLGKSASNAIKTWESKEEEEENKKR